jgi:hypothetical protein
MKGGVYTVPGLQASLKRLPRNLSAELRDASQDISVDVSRGAEAARVTSQQRLVPVKPRRDRVPKIVMGGNTRVGSRRKARAGDLMYGANFGSRRYTQFPPVRKPDHFLYATIRRMGNTILDRYGDALSKTLAKL